MMKINMTDNLYEFRNYILEDLIERGYKYIARDKDGAIYAYSIKPTKYNRGWYFEIDTDDDKVECISVVSRIFPNIEWENIEPFRIQYINWKEVPVDTPVVYNIGSGKSVVRHFCRYDEARDRVLMYANGRTSFTKKGIMETYPERVSIYKQGEKLNDGNNE